MLLEPSKLLWAKNCSPIPIPLAKKVSSTGAKTQEEAKQNRYQWLGLVVTSLSMGCILWLLFTHFTIGSPELFAHRARARALLIQSLSFDLAPVLLGFLFGFVLKRYKLNPMMVFGGILMPPAITIGLMIGACISWLDVKAKDHVPFWSGMFAGESTWIVAQIFLKLCGG